MGKLPFFEGLGWKWTISPAVWQASYAMSLIIGSLLIIGAASTGIAAVRGRLGGSRLIAWAATAAIALAAAGAALLIFRLFKRLFQNPSRKSATLLAKVSYVVAVQVAVLAVTVMLEKVLPQKEDTAFDILLKSSQSVRTTLALLAVFTAPMVEEVVYRGVLYSGLRPRVGVNWAIAIVTLLFVGVHVPQYWGAWAGLTGLTMLSLILTTVRASTGSLLPCVAIHTLNNLIGAIQILTSSPESQ
jgi:membrane protease YdiL (CAAX protease family)